MLARDNPLTVERILKVRYRLDDKGWSELLTRLARQRYRGAIVGPHGTGKTTLLEDLGERLEAIGFVCRHVSVNQAEPWSNERHFSLTSDLTKEDALLIDGADFLTAVEWMKFRYAARAAGALIITTHARGRLPLLAECTSSAEVLEEILKDLLGERLNDRLLRLALSRYELHDGNIRNVLRDLYDFFSARNHQGQGLSAL